MPLKNATKHTIPTKRGFFFQSTYRIRFKWIVEMTWKNKFSWQCNLCTINANIPYLQKWLIDQDESSFAILKAGLTIRLKNRGACHLETKGNLVKGKGDDSCRWLSQCILMPSLLNLQKQLFMSWWKWDDIA